MGLQLVPKSVTLNDLERRNGRYVALRGHLSNSWALVIRSYQHATYRWSSLVDCLSYSL